MMKLTRLCYCKSSELSTMQQNPYRSLVLSWYRRCIKASFTVPWTSDDDALYVLEETRRLFYQNMHIQDVEVIQRKIREVEMRYGLALHYNIPYPRMFHKTQGSIPESGVAYAPELDSSFDKFVNPAVGVMQEGSTNFAVSHDYMISNIYDKGDSDDNYSENENAEFAIEYRYDTSSNNDSSDNSKCGEKEYRNTLFVLLRLLFTFFVKFEYYEHNHINGKHHHHHHH